MQDARTLRAFQEITEKDTIAVRFASVHGNIGPRCQNQGANRQGNYYYIYVCNLYVKNSKYKADSIYRIFYLKLVLISSSLKVLKYL